MAMILVIFARPNKALLSPKNHLTSRIEIGRSAIYVYRKALFEIKRCLRDQKPMHG